MVKRAWRSITATKKGVSDSEKNGEYTGLHTWFRCDSIIFCAVMKKESRREPCSM